jgi:polyisoprenoid-binding protein YceI
METAVTDTSTAPSWLIDPSRSFIGFKVRHLGIATVTGQFKEYDAQIFLDPSDIRTLTARAVIRTSSVDTDNDRRDNHLRSDDFFNAARFPEMRYESRKVRITGDDTFELVGDLTIRDNTREIVLEGAFVDADAAPGERRVALEAEARLDRFEYGLKFDALTEAGGLVVDRQVRLVLQVEAVRE